MGRRRLGRTIQLFYLVGFRESERSRWNVDDSSSDDDWWYRQHYEAQERSRQRQNNTELRPAPDPRPVPEPHPHPEEQETFGERVKKFFECLALVIGFIRFKSAENDSSGRDSTQTPTHAEQPSPAAERQATLLDIFFVTAIILILLINNRR